MNDQQRAAMIRPRGKSEAPHMIAAYRAMQMALEALEDICDTLGECGMTEKARTTVTAIDEALAQPQDHSEQHLNMVQVEPVGYLVYSLYGVNFQDSYCEGAEPVYTTPPSVEAAIEATKTEYGVLAAQAYDKGTSDCMVVMKAELEAAIEATKAKVLACYSLGDTYQNWVDKIKEIK